jgi:uncharacterized protein (TIGR02246 family)
MHKEQFLQTLQAEQAAWEAFLTAIPNAQREQAGLYGQWSVKDVVGHVAAWERYLTGRLRGHLRNDSATPAELWGELVPPDELEDDALNDWMAAQLRARSFEAILGMQCEVRSQLIGAVQAMREELLTTVGVKVKGLPFHPDDPFWRVIASMSYSHARDHMAGLQTALPAATATDVDAIQTLYHQLLNRWDQQDAAGMAVLFAKDGHVVGFDGSPMNGRAEIAAVLGGIFAHHQTATYVSKVRELRMISGEVALLRAVVSMVPPGGSDIHPAFNAIQSLVAVKQAGEWRVALFHNTPAAFHGQPEASAALTEELAAWRRATR